MSKLATSGRHLESTDDVRLGDRMNRQASSDVPLAFKGGGPSADGPPPLAAGG